MNIIIVEDDSAIRKLIKMQLSLEGISDVKEYDNAEAVIPLLPKLSPDTYWAVDGELNGKLTGIDLIEAMTPEQRQKCFFIGNYPHMQKQAQELGCRISSGKNRVASDIAYLIKEIA